MQYKLVVLMNSDKHSPGKINQGHSKRIFGETIKSQYLVDKSRKTVASPDKSFDLTPEQIDKGGLPPPDFSLLHPQSTAAKLQRYIVLSYKTEKQLEQAEFLLTINPNVLNVSKAIEDGVSDFSLQANDPLSLDANNYQYGLFNQFVFGSSIGSIWNRGLNLQQTNTSLTTAWDRVRGHAYVGVVDSGLDIGHPDFTNNFRNHFSYDFRDSDDDVTFVSPLGALIAGHGQHVTGVIAADSNNNLGTTGICWSCSIMFARVGNDAAKSSAYGFLARSGAQVVNSSFRMKKQVDFKNSCNDEDSAVHECSTQLDDEACVALQLMAERDIVQVAAAGNGSPDSAATIGEATGCDNFIQFPASDDRVIAVGASDATGYRAEFSDYGSALDIVAPGADILSTFVRDHDWAPGWNCGDNQGVDGEEGYGTCTGTSMATPHITGLAALIRSADPLLDRFDVKNILITASSEYPSRDSEVGYGIPSGLKAVEKALGTVNGIVLQNRLTPLFSFYSIEAEDSFYTTVPQMASAAIHGTLLSMTSEPSPATYLPNYGWATPYYAEFPDTTPEDTGFSPPLATPTPRAEVYIFTTENNPLNSDEPLVPLYRMSYKGDYNGTNPSNLDHFYYTQAILGDDYVKDGIEGFIFSSQYPQPDNTVGLYLRYNPVRDDHAIFPADRLSSMQEEGYTEVLEPDISDYIGYVYPNQDLDNDTLVDGFEHLIGTCVDNPDSNGDGITDNEHVLDYPRTDPLSGFVACDPTSIASHPWQDNAIGTLYVDRPWNHALGYHFTPLVNGTIDQLGGYFNGAKQVKLFNRVTKALLAQATVTSTNHWNYTDIAPVSVQANQSYTVAVYMAGSGGSFRYNASSYLFPMTIDGNFRIDSSTYIGTATQPNAIPVITANRNIMYGQADVRFTPTPY